MCVKSEELFAHLGSWRLFSYFFKKFLRIYIFHLSLWSTWVNFCVRNWDFRLEFMYLPMEVHCSTSTICWKISLSFIELLLHFCWKSLKVHFVDLYLSLLFHFSVCPFTQHYIPLITVATYLEVIMILLQNSFNSFRFLCFVNFRIISFISTKSLLDFLWELC